MENKSDSEAPLVCTSKSIGSCGGAGMCPGIALMIAFGAWVGLVELSGHSWIGWLAAVPLWLILVTGIWRRLIN